MPGKRIAREKLTIKKMIALYESQCPQASAVQGHYEALFAYAQKRLDKCVFGEEKPACKQCPVHCYQPAKREEMKQIMRWAGPRMLWRHPVLTVRHLIDDKRPVPELPERGARSEGEAPGLRRASSPGRIRSGNPLR
ncbi:nitrous oxide-stimulated promoter family protein [Salmonella enterica]|nr:nitrous oxide-stimulated promoter family protein [Salmonella enterica]